MARGRWGGFCCKGLRLMGRLAPGVVSVLESEIDSRPLAVFVPPQLVSLSRSIPQAFDTACPRSRHPYLPLEALM